MDQVGEPRQMTQSGGQGRAHAIAMAAEGADNIAIDICRQIDSNPYPLATPGPT